MPKDRNRHVTIHAPVMQAQLTYQVAHRCAMPDLSKLTPPRVLGMVLGNIFGGPMPRSREPRLLVINFVRFVDSALAEYEAARIVMLENVTDGAVSKAFRCFAHLENCLVTLRRAYAALDRLKQYPEARVERLVRRFLERHRKAIRQVRNAIEHMDEYIVRGKVPLGVSVLPSFAPAGDKLTIAEHSLDLRELASVLRWMAKLSGDISHPPARQASREGA